MTAPSYCIERATGEWEVAIGLEVQAQVVGLTAPFADAPTVLRPEPWW